MYVDMEFTKQGYDSHSDSSSQPCDLVCRLTGAQKLSSNLEKHALPEVCLLSLILTRLAILYFGGGGAIVPK